MIEALPGPLLMVGYLAELLDNTNVLLGKTQAEAMKDLRIKVWRQNYSWHSINAFFYSTYIKHLHIFHIKFTFLYFLLDLGIHNLNAHQIDLNLIVKYHFWTRLLFYPIYLHTSNFKLDLRLLLSIISICLSKFCKQLIFRF